LNEPIITIVSGDIESGKTSYCNNVATELDERGWDVRGVISPAVFDGETKIAIDAVDISTAEQRRLADLRSNNTSTSGPTTKRWAFYAETIDWCNDVLKRSTPCDLLVVDELGPLEFEQSSGLLEGLVAVDTRLYQHAIVVVRSHLLDQARSRWPEAETTTVNPSDPSTFKFPLG
jgi:nucleoside-triphosphatase THEP1